MKFWVFLLSLLCVHGVWSQNGNDIDATKANITTKAPTATSPATTDTSSTTTTRPTITRPTNTTSATTSNITTTKTTASNGMPAFNKTTGTTTTITTSLKTTAGDGKPTIHKTAGVPTRRGHHSQGGFNLTTFVQKRRNSTLLHLLKLVSDEIDSRKLTLPPGQAGKKVPTTKKPTEISTGKKVTTTKKTTEISTSQKTDKKAVQNLGPKSTNRTPESGHFAVVFLVMIALLFGLYALYHNRQKIIGVVVEGRSGNGRGNRDRYRKLDDESLEPGARIKNSNEVYVY